MLQTLSDTVYIKTIMQCRYTHAACMLGQIYIKYNTDVDKALPAISWLPRAARMITNHLVVAMSLQSLLRCRNVDSEMSHLAKPCRIYRPPSPAFITNQLGEDVGGLQS